MNVIKRPSVAYCYLQIILQTVLVLRAHIGSHYSSTPGLTFFATENFRMRHRRMRNSNSTISQTVKTERPIHSPICPPMSDKRFVTCSDRRNVSFGRLPLCSRLIYIQNTLSVVVGVNICTQSIDLMFFQ